MIDTSKIASGPIIPDAGEMCAACETLHRAATILETADRIPDEAVKQPLLDGAKKLLQNVIEALDGRKTDGLVQPEGTEEDD